VTLALGIRYLNGFVAAADVDARDHPEWPPHPGRAFMALAAAHFQTGADPAERDALLWLEALPQPPAIQAPRALVRSVVKHYVPVNDKTGPSKTLLQSAPLARSRQARTFARAWLEHDTVYLTWPEADPPEPIRSALQGLCAKVTRIGHSSSLVQVWVAAPDEVGEPNWLPDDDRATVQLRLAGVGALGDLERRYNRAAVEAYTDAQAAVEELDGKARAAANRRLKAEFPDGAPIRLRPSLSVFQGYAPPASHDAERAAPGTVFGSQFIALTLEREEGPYRQLGLPCVLPITQRWHEALLSHSNDLSDGARRLVSGHEVDGTPLQAPHLAFLPLAFVGHSHADGRLLGMGLCLPDGIAREDRREVLRAAGLARRLVLGRLGTWRAAAVTANRPPWTLRPEAWTAHPSGAKHWATVTPAVFDRHSKTTDRASRQREVARMIAQACVRIGLPEPLDVVVTPVPAHLGAPPAHTFPRLRRKDGGERRHTHVILVFEHPVRGPILIGAGRYRGYGACRPMDDREPRRE